ncbi:MAG TPA: ABC transporter ATP-binding protein [Anaerolineaceae bacterium]|nr:ABC transporter ATP-binding protein [Anaerolineaceae bacterium]HPN50790.1 ABC transporter ATP-binding protein [Anaerolineaceae bacterium]
MGALKQMSQLKRMFRYVAPYLKPMLIAGFLLSIWSLIGLALPWTIRVLVDTVFVSRDLSQLNLISVSLFVLFVAQFFIGFTQNYLINYVTQRVVADLRLDIQKHLLWLPLRFFSESNVGEIVSRVTNDVMVIQVVLSEAPFALLRQIVTIIGGIVLMLMMSWQLTLLVCLLVPPLVGLMVFFGRRLEKLSTEVQDRLANATTVLEESISGIRVVKSFVQEMYEQKRFQERIEDTFRTVMSKARLRAVFMPLTSFLGLFGTICILWFGGQQVVAGALTPGELVSFLVYMLMVASPLGELAVLYSQIREAVGAAKRVFEIIETPQEPAEAANLGELPAVKGRVTFDHVSFGYEAGETVLTDINLDVEPSQVVALVGSSGVGKTTLVNMVPRFFDPTAGKIEIDGIDIRSVSLNSLREQIGLVPQDTFLFGGTVRENIAYGRHEASMEEVEAAAVAAYADEFIRAMPQGYDTVVGERGVRLSTGQRQRIAIARALLKNPRILILDEATSALDTESERWVQAALDRLMTGRTVFVIAHRLSTIQKANRILVLQHGQIAEDGTHSELLAKRGLYYRLWALQFNQPGVKELWPMATSVTVS